MNTALLPYLMGTNNNYTRRIFVGRSYIYTHSIQTLQTREEFTTIFKQI